MAFGFDRPSPAIPVFGLVRFSHAFNRHTRRNAFLAGSVDEQLAYTLNVIAYTLTVLIWAEDSG